MQYQRMIHCVDSHTMGEPTRTVVGGLPHIPGATLVEKKTWLETYLDHIRTGLMHEPRGHRDMFGSVLTAPVNPAADLGIIFMDGGGYLNMCGHGTIGAVTIALETGMLKMQTPLTDVILETPAGLVHARAYIDRNRVSEVSFTNVPAFVWQSDVPVEVPQLNCFITLDIAFGGSFFALVDVKKLGLAVAPEHLPDLVDRALTIRRVINDQIDIQHPVMKHIQGVDLVEIYDTPSRTDAHLKNVVIFGQGQVDRSPCGTGTCAKLATLYAKGNIQLNVPFRYESILGQVFEGKILDTTRVGPFDAIVPEITASACITGFNQFVFDEADPLTYGFTL